MNLWFTALLAILSLRLVAAPLDLNDRAALEWAANDDPKSMQTWANHAFENIDANQNPRLWVRALWLKAILVTEWAAVPDVQALIEKGIVLAKREGMPEELLAFKALLPGIMEELAQTTNTQIDSKAVIKEYENLIAEARLIGIKRAEAAALAAYAFYLRDLGETTRSLQLLLDANRLLTEDPQATELNRMNMKNHLALAYSYQKEEQRAKELFAEMEQFCARAKLRSFCLANDFNLGKLLVFENDATQWPKAEACFHKAMQAAQAIHDVWWVAAAHSGLMSLHIKTRAFDKAVKEADVAIKLFKEIRSHVWLADTYKKRGEALIGAKRYSEALDSIDEAQKFFPEGFRGDFNDLEDLRYQTFRGLGQTEKALQHLEKHHAEFKLMAEEREKSDYSKLMVGMGLQMEEEKNKFLVIDNELKNQKLTEIERLRLFMIAMLCLSVLVMGSMGLAVARSREVKASRTKMQRILSNIEEGILTINHRLEVESEYSQHLNVLLGIAEDLSGQPALPLLLGKSSLKEEEKSMVHEILRAAIDGDAMQWSFNEHHLPGELIYPGSGSPRIVAIHWQPLYDRHGRVQSFLIGLIDVTDRRKLEAEIALERQRADRQGRLIQELTQAEADRVDSLLAQAKALQPKLVGVSEPLARRDLLRELHTIKGIARVLGLKELSAAAHELEDGIQTRPLAAHELEDGIQSSAFAAQRDTFLGTVDDCLHIVQQIFGRRSQLIPLKRQLADIVQSILPGISEHLQDAGLALSSITLIDRVMVWSPALLQTLEQILIHALSNSADHGFILPQKRGIAIREPGFHIEAQPRGLDVELIIRDNGAGLDVPRLQEIAKKLGFHPEPGQSVADVVFLDGSTTAEQVSRTSGRGVGMAAIRSLCQQWGGDVHLGPNPEGSGTQLVVILRAEEKKASA